MYNMIDTMSIPFGPVAITLLVLLAVSVGCLFITR